MIISSTEAKAAKASTKAEDLHTKLVEANKSAAKLAASPLGQSTDSVASASHSHTKSKGNIGTPSPHFSGSYTPQQSPQQKMMSTNEQVNAHSPFRLPAGQPEVLLSSNSSYLLDTSRDKVPLVGEDTNDEHDTSSLASRTCRDVMFHGKRAKARGLCRYSSPLARARTSQMAGVHTLASKAHVMPKHTFNNSSSNGSWTDNDDNDDVSLEANINAPFFDTKSASGCSPPLSPPLSPVQPTIICGKKGPYRACLSDREEVDILDVIWPGSHNVTLLTHFVSCHFAGDWSAYLLFAHWVDS
jgi:hypothetical protein